MKSIELNPNVTNQALSTQSSIGIASRYNFESNGRELKGYVLTTVRPDEQDKALFLYLFPGQGGNEEWACEDQGYITKMMTYIMSVKMHPGMTIVMPYLFYNSNKTIDAQDITEYIKDIVDHFEGGGAWDNPVGYKKRAVGGLCLGSLSALKCALHWEKKGCGEKEKFFSVGILSPANGAEDGRWINGNPNFKFSHPEKHRLYLSYGNRDSKSCHAMRYHKLFASNGSPVNDFVEIKQGEHNWHAFRTGLADYMSDEIFAHECYVDIK